MPLIERYGKIVLTGDTYEDRKDDDMREAKRMVGSDQRSGKRDRSLEPYGSEQTGSTLSFFPKPPRQNAINGR